MTDEEIYDVAVIGGGLAGLAVATELAGKGFSVILFEKENYPFHKVCGEYISLESWDYLQSLGVPLHAWQLPVMNRLRLSAPNGNLLEQRLPLGGFGVSRYKIDHEMMLIAKRRGVVIHEGVKVQDVAFYDDAFTIKTDQSLFRSKVCCASWGKRSNLDVKWKRRFVQKKQNALNNFIGVKYHVHLDHPSDTIALHNFDGGYCGIASIEENKFNICYLTTAQNLRNNDNDISKMEKNVLFKNPHLKNIFTSAEFLFERPVTISQISFDKKEQLHDHILLMGDAAGMITPLCGNGMSIALHGSRIASRHITSYLQRAISRNFMETSYVRDWNNLFSSRLRAGRLIQEIFNHQWMTNGIINILKPFPSLTNMIIRQTHG